MKKLAMFITFITFCAQAFPQDGKFLKFEFVEIGKFDRHTIEVLTITEVFSDEKSCEIVVKNYGTNTVGTIYYDEIDYCIKSFEYMKNYAFENLKIKDYWVFSTKKTLFSLHWIIRLNLVINKYEIIDHYYFSNSVVSNSTLYFGLKSKKDFDTLIKILNDCKLYIEKQLN